MDRQAVSKIIWKEPALFRPSIDLLETKLVWLREGLALEEPDIARLVRSNPNVLRQELKTRRLKDKSVTAGSLLVV